MQSDLFRLHADLEERHWWFVGRRDIMRALVRSVVQPSRDRVVVDVGCGTGANVASLRGEYSCTGVDTSEDALALASRRYPDVRFLRGTAPAILEKAAGSTDLFLLMDVLEHVPDDFRMLSDLLAAARPGALFYITVPADMALWSAHDEIFGHYRRYDPARLEMLWTGLPVTTLMLSPFNSRLYPAVRIVRSLSNLRGGTFGRAGTDFRLPWGWLNRALTSIMAGEQRRLLKVLDGRARPYPFGSSLVAIIRREPGEITPRSMPRDVERASTAGRRAAGVTTGH